MSAVQCCCTRFVVFLSRYLTLTTITINEQTPALVFANIVDHHIPWPEYDNDEDDANVADQDDNDNIDDDDADIDNNNDNDVGDEDEQPLAKGHMARRLVTRLLCADPHVYSLGYLICILLLPFVCCDLFELLQRRLGAVGAEQVKKVSE